VESTGAPVPIGRKKYSTGGYWCQDMSVLWTHPTAPRKSACFISLLPDPIKASATVILSNIQQMDATSSCTRTCPPSHVVLQEATPDLLLHMYFRTLHPVRCLPSVHMHFASTSVSSTLQVSQQRFRTHALFSHAVIRRTIQQPVCMARSECHDTWLQSYRRYRRLALACCNARRRASRH
jgi:hypothetical protein